MGQSRVAMPSTTTMSDLATHNKEQATKEAERRSDATEVLSLARAAAASDTNIEPSRRRSRSRSMLRRVDLKMIQAVTEHTTSQVNAYRSFHSLSQDWQTALLSALDNPVGQHRAANRN